MSRLFARSPAGRAARGSPRRSAAAAPPPTSPRRGLSRALLLVLATSCGPRGHSSATACGPR
eukprot:5308749-Prymnesium_polylepis.1